MGDIPVKVLSPEDHLSMLCVHFLGHGGWRPIWLCDIAAAMESLTESFDWQTCLGEDTRRAGWILSALACAHEILGAQLGRRHSIFSIPRRRRDGWRQRCSSSGMFHTRP
jgi:hypothetical protein